MKISSWVLTGVWPTYSASRRGRMARSAASSSAPGAVLMMRSAVTAFGLLPCRALQRAPDQLLGRVRARLHGLEQPRGLSGTIAERDQRAKGLALRAIACRPRRAPWRGARRRQPVAHLDDQPLGGLAPYSGDARQRRHILTLHTLGEGCNAHSGQQRQRDLRPYPRDANQAAEQAPLLFGRKCIQHVRILAHHEVGQQAHLRPDRRQVKESRHGRLELVAETADVDGELWGSLR